MKPMVTFVKGKSITSIYLHMIQFPYTIAQEEGKAGAVLSRIQFVKLSILLNFDVGLPKVIALSTNSCEPGHPSSDAIRINGQIF